MHTLSESLNIGDIETLRHVDMSSPQGRWRWMSAISRRLDEWHYHEIEGRPFELSGCTPESLFDGTGTGSELETWRKWRDGALRARRQNQNNLYALLRCVGICSESIELAPEGKKDGPTQLREYFLSYLDEQWGVEKHDALRNQDQPAKFAARWSAEDLWSKFPPEWYGL